MMLRRRWPRRRRQRKSSKNFVTVRGRRRKPLFILFHSVLFLLFRTSESKPTDSGNDTAVAADETDATAILGDLTAADILEAVSASADQGISMISKWLGIKLVPDSNSTAAVAKEEEEEKN